MRKEKREKVGDRGTLKQYGHCPIIDFGMQNTKPLGIISLFSLHSIAPLFVLFYSHKTIHSFSSYI